MTQTNTRTGTVIHGTMRPEDLIPAFIAELNDDQRAPFQYRADIWRELVGSNIIAAQYEEQYLLEDLFDALDALAPEGMYFGAHPGDGADYGYWPVAWVRDVDQDDDKEI